MEKNIEEKEVVKTVFEQNVDTFLTENYSNENTKLIYKNLWEKVIKDYEIIKNKELYNFTKEELEALVMAVPTSATSRKTNILSFITIYCEWACSKGLINISPAINLDLEKLSKVNKKMLKKQMYSLDYVYRLCQELNNNGYIFQWLPLLLARYGITGTHCSWITNLRWCDIDFKHKLVHIIDHQSGELLKSVEVDDRFLEIIEKAKNTTSVIEIVKTKSGAMKQVTIEFIDNGYVLKKRANDIRDEIDTVTETSIYNSLQKLFRASNREYITMRSMVKSRKIELLLEKRKERKLCGIDVYEVAEMINPTLTRGAYTSLKRDYESLTKDEVIKTRVISRELDDENSLEFATKMYKELFEE